MHISSMNNFAYGTPLLSFLTSTIESEERQSEVRLTSDDGLVHLILVS